MSRSADAVCVNVADAGDLDRLLHEFITRRYAYKDGMGVRAHVVGGKVNLSDKADLSLPGPRPGLFSPNWVERRLYRR